MVILQLSASQQKQIAETSPTRVRLWTGTSRGKGTAGPDLSRSHPPNSAELAAHPESDAETKNIKPRTKQ